MSEPPYEPPREPPDGAGVVVRELPHGARVLFTTRVQGNLSSVGGLGAERGERNRARLRRELGLAALARGYQEHGADVLRVGTPPRRDAPNEGLPRADGQATALRRVGAMVLTADCLPIALACDGAVAMLHAGWRGLAAGIVREGVLAIRELAPAGEVHALVGPGAGACCYEVGPEVHAAFGSGRSGRTHIDLHAIARERLLAAGVTHVDDVGVCTICDERFFSHRREGHRAGRQAGVAWRAHAAVQGADA